MKTKLHLWVLLFVMGILVTPKLQAQSAQVYTDSEYQWQVTYPSNWQAQIGFTNDDNNPLAVIRKHTLFQSPMGEAVAIDVWHDPTTDVVTWFIQNHLQFLSEYANQNIAINGQIAGLEAILVSDPNIAEDFFPAQVAVFKRGEWVYRIEYYARNSAVEEMAYRDMLTAFQFNGQPPGANINSLAFMPEAITSRLTPLVASCGGYTDNTNNPFPCCSSGGNCTWWARYKRPDFGWDMLHNARYWYEDAIAKGYPVGQEPRAGAVGVWGQNNDAGHVVYVESVNSNGTINISQMGCSSGGPDFYNNINPKSASGFSEFLGFIYKKGNVCEKFLDKPRLYWDKVNTTSMCAGSEHRWNYWLNGTYNYYFVIRRTSGNLDFDVLLKNANGDGLYSSSSTNGVLEMPVRSGEGWYYLHVTSRNNTSGNYSMEIKQGMPGTKYGPFNFATANGALNWVGGGTYLRSSDLNSNGWRLNATNLRDPMLFSPPLGIDTSSRPYVAVTMRVTNFPSNCLQSRLYFTKDQGWGFAEAQSVGVSLLDAPTTFQTVFFDMKQNAAWTGTIGRLRLDVVNCSGSATANDSWVRITSIEFTNKGPVTVDFSPQPAQADIGQAVTFTSQVTGNPDTLTWDWGDGTPAGSGAAPTHVFNSEGTFTVTLTGSHALSSAMVSKTVIVKASHLCPTDVNGDSVTDLLDIQMVASKFGVDANNPAYEAMYDINGDAVIDILDIQLAAGMFGAPCS